MSPKIYVILRRREAPSRRTHDKIAARLYPAFKGRLLRGGRRGPAEMRVMRVVGEGRLALGRQILDEIERALDVVAPDLARQFVQDLDPVAVGITDIEAVGHAVIDPAVELDPLVLQPGELFQPGLAV